MECVDGLLEGDAARWTDSYSRVKKLLTQENVEHADQSDIKAFSALLLKRFTPVEKDNKDDVSNRIWTLAQQPTEALEHHYRRAEDWLHAAGGEDKPDTVTLSSSEIALLAHVIEHFVKGICDRELRIYLKGPAPMTGVWLIQ